MTKPQILVCCECMAETTDEIAKKNPNPLYAWSIDFETNEARCEACTQRYLGGGS